MVGYKNFTFRIAWASRNCVVKVTPQIGTSAANEWKEEKLKSLLSKHAAEDIFKADEIALFYKIMPEKILAFKRDK